MWTVLSYAQYFSLLQWHSWCSQANTVPHKVGKPPNPLQHFNNCVQLSLHTTFLPCIKKPKRERGEHRVAHEQVNWDSISISVLLSMDSAGFPVALSWPQCLKYFNVWTLRNAETYFTWITQYWSLNKQTAVCLQHMSNLYIIWFKEKMLFRMSMYELEFKLFLFFIESTDLFWQKSYVNIWFISHPGNKRFMCAYSIKSNVFDRRDVSQDWGSSTQIWISTLWMYYSSVLYPVESPSAWLFNTLRCHLIFSFYLLDSFIGPYFPILVTPILYSRNSCSVLLSEKNCVQRHISQMPLFSSLWLAS